MNKRTKSFLLSILTLSFIFYSCSNLANDLQKRKNQNLFNITIQECQNGTVTAAKSSGIKAGEEVILSVTGTTGYELKTISVTNTQNKDVAVAAMEQGTSYKFTMPASDVTVSAAFDKTGPVDITEPGDLSSANGNTFYRIEHYQQDLDDTNSYTLYAIQKKKGNAGTDTEAVAQNYPGFNSLNIEQEKIAGDGTTVIEVYYDRKMITYSFSSKDGFWRDGSQTLTMSGLFESTIDKKNLEKAGYTISFNKAIPNVFGPDNEIYTASIRAKTDTQYKIRLYHQAFTGGDDYFLQEELQMKGTTDTKTNYNAVSKTGFYIIPYEQKNIDGDGSCILDIYYNRLSYTVNYELNGGSGLQSEELLYGDNPKQIPEKEGYTFYKWYTDSSYSHELVPDVGITSSGTLYAYWIDNSITYRFHEKIEPLPAGTDGTYGTDGEYVYFGDYPQSLKSDDVEIYTDKIVRGFVGGSDGNLYYYGRGNKYYKVEPIKWRVLRLYEYEVVLAAENILDICEFDVNAQEGDYLNSTIRSFLNSSFLSKAFTDSAQNIITPLHVLYSSEGKVNIVSEEKDKIHLFETDSFNYVFHSYNSIFRECTDYSKDDNSNSLAWWLPISYHTADSYFAYLVIPDDDYMGGFSVNLPRGVVPTIRLDYNVFAGE